MSESEYLELLQWILYNSTYAYGVAANINQMDEDELNISNRLAWTSILVAVTTTILVASSRNSLRLL